MKSLKNISTTEYQSWRWGLLFQENSAATFRTRVQGTIVYGNSDKIVAANSVVTAVIGTDGNPFRNVVRGIWAGDVNCFFKAHVYAPFHWDYTTVERERQGKDGEYGL